MSDSIYYNAERKPVDLERGAVFNIQIYKNPNIYHEGGLISYGSLVDSASSSSSSGSSSSGSSSSGSSSSGSSSSGSSSSSSSGSSSSGSSSSGSSSSGSSSSGSSSSGSSGSSVTEANFPLPTKAVWNRVCVSIRQSNFKMCQGGINTGFFSGDTVNDASVIFLLYHLSTLRDGNVQKTLIGFALTNDLRSERDLGEDTDEGTLYIDAICTNTDVRHARDGNVKGAGFLLMNEIESYAKNPHTFMDGEPFTSIKLSALPYVISYYRRLGYRHINHCRELKHTSGDWVEQDDDIHHSTAEVHRLKIRFKNDEDLDNALKVELAKEKKILVVGKGGEREKQDYLISNLNKYFKPDNILFIKHKHSKKTTVVAIDKDTSKKHAFITKLLSQDNSPLLKLLNVLRIKGFSVSCQEQQARHMRHNVKKDSDGDIDFHCLNEGFTMRKCLNLSHRPDAASGRGRGRGRSTVKKISLKKKGKKFNISNIHNSMSKRMNRAKSQRKVNHKHSSHRRSTHKKVPWSGWSRLAPSAKQRTVMKRRCGKKCFLGPGKSFPVCKKGTCKVSKKGAWAAFIRAKEWGKKRSTYKGRGHPTHSRRIYQTVARKAKRIINR